MTDEQQAVNAGAAPVAMGATESAQRSETGGEVSAPSPPPPQNEISRASHRSDVGERQDLREVRNEKAAHTCHDMNPPFPYECAACIEERIDAALERGAEHFPGKTPSRMPPCATCGHGWPMHIIPDGAENIDIYPTERWCVEDDCRCRNYVEASR